MHTRNAPCPVAKVWFFGWGTLGRGIFTLVPIPSETTPRETLDCLKEPSLKKNKKNT
jgi:hypothetical protein